MKKYNLRSRSKVYPLLYPVYPMQRIKELSINSVFYFSSKFPSVGCVVLGNTPSKIIGNPSILIYQAPFAFTSSVLKPADVVYIEKQQGELLL